MADWDKLQKLELGKLASTPVPTGLVNDESSDSGNDAENCGVKDDRTIPAAEVGQVTVALGEKGDDDCGCSRSEQEEYPDGGWRAWLVVLGAFMGLFPIWGTLSALGALEGYIAEHQLADSKSVDVSWIFSLHLTVCSACCVFSGSYFDRNGGRRAIIVGAILYVFGIFMLSECTEIWHFILAFSVSSGMGAGILTTPLISCIATWFYKRRAAATSLATIGSSMGGILLPLILRRLYVQVGYKWAVKVVAFLFLLCLSFAAVFARERITPKPEPFKSMKETVHFYVSTSLNWRYFLDKRFLWCAIAFSVSENSICVTATYITSYIMKRDFNPSMPYTALTVINAAGIPGRYIPAYFADRYFGRYNVIMVVVLLAAVVELGLWLPFGANANAMWVFAALYGFLTGSIFSLTPVCISQICRTSDFGKYYSTAYLLNTVVTVPLIPIAGALISDGTMKSYDYLIIFAAILMLLGGVSYLISRIYCVGVRNCKF